MTKKSDKSPTRRQHYVRFLSPGTLFSEESTYKVQSWDPKEAVRLSEGVKERYGAVPYGFYFETYIEHDPIPDGEGDVLKVESKIVDTSAMYYITGKVFSYAEIEKRNRGDEEILRSNMRCNKYAYVVENTNSYKTIRQFDKSDCVVDASGNVLIRGDDPEFMKYRRRFDKECEQYFAALTGG